MDDTIFYATTQSEPLPVDHEYSWSKVCRLKMCMGWSWAAVCGIQRWGNIAWLLAQLVCSVFRILTVHITDTWIFLIPASFQIGIVSFFGLFVSLACSLFIVVIITCILTKYHMNMHHCCGDYYIISYRME